MLSLQARETLSCPYFPSHFEDGPFSLDAGKMEKRVMLHSSTDS